MLDELAVRNYALIGDLTIRFTPGFNVLSGETGAGKSILIGALGLILGSKGDTTAIRTGYEEASVTGIVQVEGNADVLRWLEEREIEPDDGSMIIRRTLRTSGRGSIYVQNVPVTRADLEELSALLVDLHGQHEHQSLLSVDNHRRLLDRYGDLEQLAADVSERFQALSNQRREYESLLSADRDRLREQDILSFAAREIEEAKLKPGEEDDLVQERNLLSQSERLFSLLEQMYAATSESRGGALAQLREARDAMEDMTDIDPSLVPQAKRLDDAFFEIEDVAETIRHYRDAVDFSPGRLEDVEERIALIHRLEKKYGDSVDAVLAYGQEARRKLQSLENWEEEKQQLADRIAAAERELGQKAQELSRKRRDAAGGLQKKIESHLSALGMPKATFTIALRPRLNAAGKPVCGPHGLDAIEFEISLNPGEPLKPLRSVASGGEISRIMLAVKSVLAESDAVSTLVFDEIDVGIGGEIALSVGEQMYQLSRHKQVLCITHLATIAARADNHIMVEKSVHDHRTETRVSVIEGEEKIREIARMLSGDRIGEASVSHAEDLLNRFSRQ